MRWRSGNLSRCRLFEKDGYLQEQVNPDLWPTVDDSRLSEIEKNRYVNRRDAIVMYFKRVDMKEIQRSTHISPQNLRRLVKRCIDLDENGVVWGFRALIPYKKVKSYRLDVLKEDRNESRKTGEFNLLLETHPDIKDLITDLYLGTHRRTLEPAMKPLNIHKKFIEQCRNKGIPLSQYPFNTKNMGRKALQRFLNRIAYLHFGEGNRRYGQDAKTRAKHTGEGEQNHPSTLHPYQKVQFDAHRIDGFFIVDLATPEGDLVSVTLDRFWILTLIDVATRIVLGYSISLSKEYSASDVMICFRNSVIPHEKIPITIDGMKYSELGGFPSEVYPQNTSWAVWDVICFDNAKSHLANLVKDRLKNLIGCATNLGPVALPMRRGIIERFFKTLEETGFHRLPNTTGSNPDDPRRKNPEKNAIRYHMTFEHLKQLIDVMISDYNGTPHGGIYHQSPLELLGKRLNNGLLPRHLEEEKRSEVLFMQTVITRTVRGSHTSGKKPYIQYEGVEYRSDKLAHSAHLINKELRLHVNVDDLRTVKAYLEDGSEFDYLTAAGKWSLTPHSLQTRKAINSLVQRKLIHYTTWDDPVFIYTDYLMKNATLGKRGAANKVTQVREASNKNKKRVNEPAEQTKALQEAEEHNDALERARQISKRQQENVEYEIYEELLKVYKTKI